MEIYIIFSGLFFLYFILLRKGCSELVSCQVQKFVSDSLIFQHLFLFFSIFMLIFIMNKSSFKYYDTGLVTSKNDKKLTFSLLADYLKYTVVIYVLFILVSKSDSPYIGIVFLLVSLIIFANIIEDVFIQEEESENRLKKIDLMTKIKKGLYVIFAIFLLLGTFKYYQRQSIEHKKKWSWITFFLGKCTGNN